MSSPVMLHSQPPHTYAPPPTISTALLLRTPISPAEGTDAYHDAFGTFCLPSFPMSALDSGATTPVAAGFGFGMTVGGRVGGSEGEAQKERMRMSGTGVGSSRGDGAAPPRPEEQLLQALQRQQLSINTSGNDKRAGSPHRNYTRAGPGYDNSQPSSPSSPSAAKKEGQSSSSQEAPRKTSFVLTTHHATSSSAAAYSAQEQREWCVTSMQVLSSQSANHDNFDRMLSEGRWAGVVATSTRAWDNWKAAVKRCKAKGKAPVTDWQQTPFFLISPRAAATFRSSTLEGLPKEWTPSAAKAFGCPANAKNQGADAEGKGAGEALGQYIVGWLQRRAASAPPTSTPTTGEQPPTPARPPLLLLQGDKSLPALPDVLSKNDIPFETIRVYETCEDPSLEDNLNRLQLFYTGLGIHGDEQEATLLLNSAEDDNVELSASTEGARPDWIVFFSPSGVDYSARHLRTLGWLPPVSPTEGDTNTRDTQDSAYVGFPRYVALGPTTAKHLRDQYGLYTEADLANANGGSLAPPSAPEEEATVPESNGKSNGHDNGIAKTAKIRSPAMGRACVFVATSTDPKGVREAIKQGEEAIA